MAFDTLMDLHKIHRKKAQPYRSAPRFLGLAEAMWAAVKRLGPVRFLEVWPPRDDKGVPLTKGDIKKEKSFLLGHALEYFEELQSFFDHHYKRPTAKPYTFLQFSQDYLGGEKPLREIPGKKKLENAFDWIYGEWLEEYTLNCLERIRSSCGLDDVFYDINMLTPGRREFQMDVACMRGHMLFGFSCTVDPGKSGLQKLKLFEVQVRARQLGGDHARYALVCLSDVGTVEDLKKDVEESWDAPSHVGVFGEADVMGGDFPERLQRWIDSV